MGRTRWVRELGFLASSLVAIGSCSLGSSLDDLKSGTGGAAHDGGFDGPVAGGKCILGEDCTGCADCKAWCACVANADPVGCLATCNGSAGLGGTGGSSWPGEDATSESTEVGSTTCSTCMKSACTTQGDECGKDAGCKATLTCVVGCENSACVDQCIAEHPDAGATWFGMAICLSQQCAKECGRAGVANSVGCFLSSCALPGDICCLAQFYLGGWCVSAGGSCSSTKLSCDGPEDCAGGQTCCATIESTQYFDYLASAACGTNCSHIVCGTDSSVCPSGKTCSGVPGICN